MNIIPVKYVLLDARARLPEYVHGPEEDAGMDLFSVEDAMLIPGQPQAIRTGLSVELPPGVEMQIRSRSGLALKHAVSVLNAPATIDPGYRGEIKVILFNASLIPYQITHGNRIAQMVIAPYFGVQWDHTGELTESSRGAGGFGSSGY